MATEYVDLQLDQSTGDLLITESGDFQLITENINSLWQRLLLRFSIWQNEWQFNLDFGFPYESYLGNKIPKEVVDAKIRETVRLEPDVLRIQDFTSSFNTQTRQYEAYLTIITQELEEVNVAYFGDGYYYPSPDGTAQDLCPSLGEVEFGAKLYHFINFRLPFTGDSTWINTWQGLYKYFKKIQWNSLLQWSQQGISWGGSTEF
ncbi:hypothetical protein BNCALIDO_00037 [Aeromonas phage vB_AdhM_TS9]|nr:hypothetical protein BNCALIDO_00037 [Aeromonas phage vB_AdhM_TS9]